MNTFPNHIIDQHNGTIEMLSKVAFWEMELSFFEKLLRKMSISTGEQYGDRMAEMIFERLVHLQEEVKVIHNGLTNHEKFLSDIVSGNIEFEEDVYNAEGFQATSKVNAFEAKMMRFKKELIEFSERYGTLLNK